MLFFSVVPGQQVYINDVKISEMQELLIEL